jgi:hypothetical protein
MEQQQVKYPIRMPRELREQLAVAAKLATRSVNGEIVYRLRESLKQARES